MKQIIDIYYLARYFGSMKRIIKKINWKSDLPCIEGNNKIWQLEDLCFSITLSSFSSSSLFLFIIVVISIIFFFFGLIVAHNFKVSIYSPMWDMHLKKTVINAGLSKRPCLLFFHISKDSMNLCWIITILICVRFLWVV